MKSMPTWLVVALVIIGVGLKLLTTSANFTQRLATNPAVLSEENSGPNTSPSQTPTPTFVWTSPSPTSMMTPTPTPKDDFDRSGSSNSPTPNYYESSYTYSSSGPGSGTSDRLANIGDATLSCIKARLTSNEFDRLRFLVPQTTQEQEELKNLSEKVKVCFETYSETVKIGEASGKISELPGDVRDCLIKAVGPTAFEEINSGIRAPTQEEKLRGDVCFAQKYESKITYQSKDLPLNKEIENCLVLALGQNRFNDIKDGKSTPSASETTKAERCFGASIYPLQKRPRYSLGIEVEACLKNSLGDERFNQINSGKSETKDEEKKLAEECFVKIHPVQKRLLPVPPIQVPFLEEVPEEIYVSSIFSESIEVSAGKIDRRLVISGVGPLNSVVEIYIFSEPIVVVTETDENGDWVYRLSEPLSAGSHVAYATIKDRSGNAIRSSVYNFDVLAAEPGEGALLEEQKATAVRAYYLRYAILLIIIGVVVGYGGFWLMVKKMDNKKAYVSEKLPDGEGEGETGAGTVN